MDTLFNILSSLDINVFSNLILLGDFNIDNLSPSHYLYHHLSQIFDCFSLSQVNSTPTHCTNNGHWTLIDLAILSSPEHLSVCETIPPLGNSDHLGLHVVINRQAKQCVVRNNTRRQVWRYAQADFDSASLMLSNLDLNMTLDPDNISWSWNCWKRSFLDIMKQCIPSALLPTRRNLPWLSKPLIQLMRKRNLLYRKARDSNNQELWDQYRNARNKLVSKLREEKSTYFSRLNPRDCKNFWQAIKYISKKESSIPTLRDDNSPTVASTSTDKANMLNNFFSRCFNHALPPLSPEFLHPTDTEAVDPELLSDLLCSEDEICGYLLALDTNKASGADGISAKMLRETAHSITPAVTKLFNISLTLGKLPADWKHALITPIPKSTEMTAVSNYRPISLLPLLSKVLERHVHSLLLKHLYDNDPISSAQFGFLKGRSTTGALVSAVNDWHTHLDNGLDICVVFFDLRKAFDSVPHMSLLNKLASLNLNPYLYRWIENYLCQRTQAVGVEGETSATLPVVSGVPQGSVLGPLLFLIYIDGLSRIQLSDGTLILFADDIVIYRPVRSTTDFLMMQNDTDTISAWIKNNLLTLNVQKCKQMIISRKQHPLVPVSMVVDGKTLELVTAYKYLGVWITSDLNWAKQIEENCKRANQKIGMLYRRFYEYCSTDTLRCLYVAFVRPHLEYAVPVWDPHLIKHTESLEKVQKFALKVCTKSWDSSYNCLLSQIDLPRLDQRRVQLKLSFLYQLINSLTFCPHAPVCFRNVPVNVRNNNPLLLARSICRTNSHYYSFYPHAISLWNDLPHSITSATSLYSFKRNLNQYLSLL